MEGGGDGERKKRGTQPHSGMWTVVKGNNHYLKWQ